jgi:hypothetical protein
MEIFNQRVVKFMHSINYTNNITKLMLNLIQIIMNITYITMDFIQFVIKEKINRDHFFQVNFHIYLSPYLFNRLGQTQLEFQS